MDNLTAGGVGTVGLLVALGIVMFLVVLAVASIKIYGIHAELLKTNCILATQNELLTAIVTEIHFGAMWGEGAVS